MRIQDIQIQRSAYEIQKAHDILHCVVSEEVPMTLDKADRMALHAAHDVLGWILGHECGEAFANSLKEIERTVDALGYVLREVEEQP